MEAQEVERSPRRSLPGAEGSVLVGSFHGRQGIARVRRAGRLVKGHEED